MNEAALRKKTAHGPAAATMKPPNAGPIARAMLMPTLLSAIAAGKSEEGTNSGVIACQTDKSKRDGVIWPIKANRPIATAMTHIHICMTRSKRRRSTTSASAPAGKATRTTGKLPAVSTSATKTGEGVSDVINHASPTSCIHVPMYEATEAIHNARKSDTRSGPQADASLWESSPS